MNRTLLIAAAVGVGVILLALTAAALFSGYNEVAAGTGALAVAEVGGAVEVWRRSRAAAEEELDDLAEQASAASEEAKEAEEQLGAQIQLIEDDVAKTDLEKLAEEQNERLS